MVGEVKQPSLMTRKPVPEMKYFSLPPSPQYHHHHHHLMLGVFWALAVTHMVVVVIQRKLTRFGVDVTGLYNEMLRGRDQCQARSKFSPSHILVADEEMCVV